jgi:adenylylsulfate reductase subunit A
MEPSMKEERLQTDILIIGGGVAGLNAALTAREAGMDVVILDKAVIERSGHTAGGIDHFGAYLETGPDWDTREAYLGFTARSARGATDLSVVEKVYCDELTGLSASKRSAAPKKGDGTYFGPSL